MTQEKCSQMTCPDSTSCAEDFLARLSQLLEKEPDSQTREELSSLRLPVWLEGNDLDIFYLKMYPDCYRITKARRSTQSSVRYRTWGITWNGRCLTAKISESPSPENECILSDILIRCTGKILPFTGTNRASLIQVLPGSQGSRVYSAKGVSCTLTSEAGGMGGKTGLYDVGVPIKENTKKGYKMAYEGDSIDLAYAEQNTRRGRVGHRIAHTLTTESTQGTVHFVDLDHRLRVTEEARCLNTRQDEISCRHLGERSGVLEETGARAILNPEKKHTRQNGRRMKEPEEPMFTLTATDRHGVSYQGRIRRLTPRECFRLQGYRDEQIDKILAVTSDAQAYKQAGNGVTVNVIEAIGRRIREVHELLQKEGVQKST